MPIDSHCKFVLRLTRESALDESRAAQLGLVKQLHVHGTPFEAHKRLIKKGGGGERIVKCDH